MSEGFVNIGRYTPPFTVLCCGVLIFLNLANFVLCNEAVDSENNKTHNNKDSDKRRYANESLLEARDLFEATSGLVWSQFLEDYVLSQSASSNRASKDLPYMSNNDMFGPAHLMPMNPNGPINYHSSAYKPQQRPAVYITKRIGEAVELEPHMRPPVQVVNPQFRPMTNQMIHQQQQEPQLQRQTQGFFQQLFGIGGGGGLAPQQQQQQQQPQIKPVPLQQQQQQHPAMQHGGPPQPPFRAVSENDLYLLGAIEKLVYRVDYLESRIRRSEQLIYYLMAGNNQKEVRDPCPANFTRNSDNCYYINSNQQVNWKTANSACKALNSHLAEFEKVSENEEIMAYLLNQPNHRGRDFWLGGLNPGLLWIWSNSAKPVNPNMNLTSIAMKHENAANATVTNLIDHKDDEVKKPVDDADKASETILNNTLEIKGTGRCLRLSYNTSKHSYAYYGQECTSRHYYICETEDKTLDNKIKKITRDLKLFD